MMVESVGLPEVIVFAGPNGSGKTTITRMAKTVGTYINADDIKRESYCSDLKRRLQRNGCGRTRLRKKLILRSRRSFLWIEI